MNLYICCFFIGFLIDKISLFPFILGFIVGLMIDNNSQIYETIKFPVLQAVQLVKNKFDNETKIT